MKCVNLHCHKIEIYFLDISKIKKNYSEQRYKLSKYDIKIKAKKLEILDEKKYIEISNKPSPDDLYIIWCNYCKKIYKDYNSNFNLFRDKDNSNKDASVFCTKSSFSKYKFNDIECFQFVELKDCILAGTKDEINLYVCESYRTLEKNIEELTVLNKNNENLINEKTNELNNEKLEKEQIQNEKEKLEEENNSLRKDLQNEKLLNSKLKETVEQLKFEQINLNKKITNLNVLLDSEKNKNKDLSDKLDRISFENNANVRKVLEQIENEKSENKNLSSNISQLKEVLNKQKIENESLEKLKKKRRKWNINFKKKQ